MSERAINRRRFIGGGVASVALMSGLNHAADAVQAVAPPAGADRYDAFMALALGVLPPGAALPPDLRGSWLAWYGSLGPSARAHADFILDLASALPGSGERLDALEPAQARAALGAWLSGDAASPDARRLADGYWRGPPPTPAFTGDALRVVSSVVGIPGYRPDPPHDPLST